MDLFEGLREGDLEGLVLPTLSIDEFETKLDDDAIVVAFHVQDREPANDLNRFIQKGAVALLDTDVSPAPNEDGYYLVFVELERDDTFPERMMHILDSVRGLANIEAWTGTFYDVEGDQEVDQDTLTKLVRLHSHEDAVQDEALGESLVEFFSESALNNMWVEGSILHLESIWDAYNLEVVDFGPYDELVEHNPVLTQGLRLDETAQRNIRSIQRLLGDHWLVEHLDEHLLISQGWDQSRHLLVRV
jgi:hypothetical protein